MYEIKSFIESSFLDWDGKISSVIFLPGCNLRCIYCHNHKLVISPDELPELSWHKIYNYLISHKKWIDGVCITGGEPCNHKDIEKLLKKIKDENFAIKLDTNGFFPEKLKIFIEKKLIDYAAMDIKAPLNVKEYSYIANIKKINLNKIMESIEILHSSSIGYEFRTTLVPGIIGQNEIESIIQILNKKDKYVLQNFNPAHAFLPELRHIKPYKESEMISFKKFIIRKIEYCSIRG